MFRADEGVSFVKWRGRQENNCAFYDNDIKQLIICFYECMLDFYSKIAF